MRPCTERPGLCVLCVCWLRLLALSAPPLNPAPPGRPRPGEPARRPRAAVLQCLQKRAAAGACEEPREGRALCQGSAAVPAQPGGGQRSRAGGDRPGGPASHQPRLPPKPPDWQPSLHRMSVTVSWSCSPPTSTSRPTALKDSHSRWGGGRYRQREGWLCPWDSAALLSCALAGAVTSVGPEHLPA